MKTIYALIGSCAGEASHTGIFSDLLAQELMKSSGTAWRYTKKTADQWNLNFCRSCGQCFSKGRCSLSGSDGLEQICREILEADFLIIGTPIYAASLSGSLKNLIDRLSLWLHTMPLIGKTCAVITTTSGNHLGACVPYLTEIFSLMGATVAAHGSVYTGYLGHPRLSLEEDMTPIVASMAASMLQAEKNPAYFTEVQKGYFLKQNRHYQFMKEYAELFPSSLGEARLWEQQGYFLAKSMENVINKPVNVDA